MDIGNGFSKTLSQHLFLKTLEPGISDGAGFLFHFLRHANGSAAVAHLREDATTLLVLFAVGCAVTTDPIF